MLFSNTFDIRKYNFLRWIERWYFYPYCAIRHYKYKDKRTAGDLSTIRTANDLSTIQFRFIFKGRKSLEYCCLVTHLTISYAESNGGIFILIAPLGITNHWTISKLHSLYLQFNVTKNTRTNVLRVICLSAIRTASDLSTIQFRLIFKGLHKSLEYSCFVIHLTSVNTISYAESNVGIFSLTAPLVHQL
jgi:hypothetical protein